ncbi:unnamed protein product [Moneuplotes crassus]|uniref:Uncharacterized protein n=1 Tax=Euplotes crassus TaxID=5936 RepID=A0AAD1XZI4_EUPCR|nr:unnamed protein product [Moneuplotes crassus]
MGYNQSSTMSPRKYVTFEMVERKEKLRTLELLVEMNVNKIAERAILVDFLRAIHENWREEFKDYQQEISKLKEEKRNEKNKNQEIKINASRPERKFEKHKLNLCLLTRW